MNKVINFFKLFLIGIFFSNVYAGTAPLINDLFVITHSVGLNTTSKCSGIIEYPELFKLDSPIADKININIKDFLDTTNFCYTTDGDIQARFDVITGNNNYFSIKWFISATQNKQLFIRTLNFNKLTGELLKFDEILNPMARNFMPELVKLSENHLAADTSWEQFVDKIHQGYIQFYITKSQWHIIFNPHRGINNLIVDKKLPSYLLKG